MKRESHSTARNTAVWLLIGPKTISIVSESNTCPSTFFPVQFHEGKMVDLEFKGARIGDFGDRIAVERGNRYTGRKLHFGPSIFIAMIDCGSN